MICPACERETKGVINNRRELRCEYCYVILPPVPVVITEVEAEKTVRRKTTRKARAN